MKLFNNTAVYFDDLTHTYLNKDNKELIGVTTLMKKMGVAPEYDGIDAEVLERAARRGSETHKAIERYCKNMPLAISDEFKEETEANLEAFKALNIAVIDNEYLVSDGEHIASSIDIVAGDDDNLTLIDTKTTYEVHREAVAWQLSIYKYLFELQNKDCKVKELKCLHLRGGKATMIAIPEVPQEEVQKLIKAYIDGKEYVKTDLLAPTEEQMKAIRELQLLEEHIVALEQQVKDAKAMQTEWKSKIISFMEERSIKKWDISENLSLTYVAPILREVFDSKRFRDEHPEEYYEYTTHTTTKASLRIKIK